MLYRTTPTRPVSPSEVLNALRRHHAVLVGAEEAEDIAITPATKVSDWPLCELSRPWVARANFLNQLFDIRIPMRSWKPVLTPARDRELGSVCEFIAEHSRVPRISSLRILGSDCRTAGAFTTLRSMIEDCGVDAGALHPSTPLSRYENEALPLLYLDLLRIAPSLQTSMWPVFRSDLPLKLVGALLFYAILPCGILAVDGWLPGVPLFVATLCGFVFVWRWSEVRASRPHRVLFRDLQTFADLSRVLADAGSPAPRAIPVFA